MISNNYYKIKYTKISKSRSITYFITCAYKLNCENKSIEQFVNIDINNIVLIKSM